MLTFAKTKFCTSYISLAEMGHETYRVVSDTDTCVGATLKKRDISVLLYRCIGTAYHRVQVLWCAIMYLTWQEDVIVNIGFDARPIYYVTQLRQYRMNIAKMSNIVHVALNCVPIRPLDHGLPCKVHSQNDFDTHSHNRDAWTRPNGAQST